MPDTQSKWKHGKEDNMKLLLEEAKLLSEEITAYRRHIHQNPETGMHLTKTCDYVMQCLTQMGLCPSRIGECGVTVTLGRPGGKTFLLRADMDALPIGEETGLPFAAANGNMHACGHDCHAAMLLGAARLLKGHEAELEGQVKLLFQPGEETMEGAKSMIDAGILENPIVDAAMMIHIISGAGMKSGMWGVFGPGVSYASVDWFHVAVQGRGGHGASPNLAVNPLGIMSDIYHAVQDYLANGLSPFEQTIMTFGEMHGGNTANIIPDTAYMTGTIRTFDEAVRNKLKNRLPTLCADAARLKGGSAQVSYTAGAPCVVSDRFVRERVMESARNLLGAEWVADLATAGGGALAKVTSSEDFAYIAQKVPSAVLWFVSGTAAEGYAYPGHHPKVDFREDLLYQGAAVYAACAIDWLRDDGNA